MIVDWGNAASLCFLVLFTASVPGADMAYILSQSVKDVPSHALAAVGGIFCGLLIYIGLIGLGFFAILKTFPALYGLIRAGGIVYLFYLAALYLKSALQPAADDTDRTVPAPRKKHSEIWLGGVGVSLLNPKTTLFFTALLPQFVNPELGHIHVQILTLGLLSILTGCNVYTAIALAAAHGSSRMRFGPRARRRIDFILAGLFALFGLLFCGEALHERGR